MNVRADGLRFASEFLEAMGGFDADDHFSGADVLLGFDGPHAANAAVAPFGPFAGAGAGGAAQGGTPRQHARRLEKVSAELLKYQLDENLKSALRAANPANARDAHAMWLYINANCVDTESAMQFRYWA